MKKFMTPDVEVVKFEMVDVITTSTTNDDPTTPTLPATLAPCMPIG